MAGFSDCIRSAQRQGVLSEDEADVLINRYDEHRQSRRAAGDTDPEGGARTALAGELEARAAKLKENVRLARENRDELKGYIETYRTPSDKADVFAAVNNLIENHGNGAATSSLAGSAKSKFTMAMGEVSTQLSQSRRSFLSGRRFNKPMAEDVIKEILGESTGKPESRAMADAFSGLFERLRVEFNMRGGDIGKLENWAPQYHDARAVLAAKFEGWRDYIKPKLDLEKMRDPLTGGALSPERLDATLRAAWRNIVTEGWASREPSAQPFGLGALSNQRNEHRFLHFKSADDWLAYNKDFGKGDPLVALIQHVRGMTSDLAAMERFGPNPPATIEWLKQVVANEAAKHVAGEPSLFNGDSNLLKVQDAIGYAPKQIQAVYDAARGAEVASNRIATGFGNVRNVLTSAQLGGSSVLAAVQDPFLDMAGRHLSGIPAGKAMFGILKTFSSDLRNKALRAGLNADDFARIVGSEARYAGELGGGETTRWLADRTVTWNGLEPMTQARKAQFGVDFAGAVADRRNMSFDELGNEFPAMRRTFEDYGINARGWDKLRAVDPHEPTPGSAGMVRPIDVAQTDRPLAERYLEAILQQTERTVPTGTARSRAFATLGANKGTVVGEVASSFLQYKSFSLSLMSLQWQGMMMEARAGSVGGVAASGGAMVARGAAYAGTLAFAMTMAGAAAMQMKNIFNGKDLQDMDAAFWIQALQYGGGLGILGDFMLSDVNRFGQTQTEAMLGPLFGLVVDVADKTVRENFAKAIRSRSSEDLEKTAGKFGRNVINNVIGRYTPVASSLFYTRAAYRRMFLDQLQYHVDPEAHQHFRAQEQTLHRQTGQGFFWHPGETLPQRMPQMSGPRP